MDPTYWMLFDEVRHALEEVRMQRYRDAERTLEGVLLVNQFVRHYRQRDPQALRMARVLRHLEWEWTPEGRLEWERCRLDWERRWTEWERSPEWLREQARLQEMAREATIREGMHDAGSSI